MTTGHEVVRNFPEGIEDSHVNAKAWHGLLNPVAVLAIAGFLGLALAGVFGGQPHPTRVVNTTSVSVTVQFPEILRNGEFFEMRANVTAKQPIENLTLSISSTYWRDMTINTMLPAPSEETSKDEEYLLSYGPMDAGDTLTLKFDGQINPPMFAGTAGELKLTDGNTRLATLPLNLRVFP